MAKLPPQVTAEIVALDSDGLGVAEVDGRALRIRNALPGETVEARILRKRKGNLFADGVAISNASEQRQPNACCYFPRCGGCVLHHLAYTAQLELKQRQLTDALRAHDVEPGEWLPAQSATRLGYRRKARFGVRMVDGRVLVGFRESFSNRVARIDGCVTLTKEISSLLTPLKALLEQTSIADRIPQIEVAQGDQTCALLVRHLAPANETDLHLCREFERRFRVRIYLQSGGVDSLVALAQGSIEPLGYQLQDWGLYLRFLPHQFTQVNLCMNRVLIRHALAYLGDLRGKAVVDLFCGIGNFSLPLARAGADVTGYEGDAGAVAMARDNAALNGLSRQARFDFVDLYGVDDVPLVAMDHADVLLLDPPRCGAGVHLDRWLEQFRGSQVVYVSCNPLSFAADAARLIGAGYRLDRVGIFDMFPNTAHVETLGYFCREPGTGRRCDG